MKSKIFLLLGTALLTACNSSTKASQWSQLNSSAFMNWQNADSYCQKMTTGGEKWRLPSQQELVNRYQSSSQKAAWDINGGGFDWVWSSTNSNQGGHFLVNVNNGSKSWPGDARSAYVICTSGESLEPNAWLDEALNAMRLQQWKRAINAATPPAEKNVPQALMILAKLNFDGNGAPKNEKKALSLYLKAANQGYALAQLSVAVLYETGKGTVPDINQALYWYEKAAAQGDEGAAGAVIRLRKQ